MRKAADQKNDPELNPVYAFSHLRIEPVGGPIHSKAIPAVLQPAEHDGWRDAISLGGYVKGP